MGSIVPIVLVFSRIVYKIRDVGIIQIFDFGFLAKVTMPKGFASDWHSHFFFPFKSLRISFSRASIRFSNELVEILFALINSLKISALPNGEYAVTGPKASRTSCSVMVMVFILHFLQCI